MDVGPVFRLAIRANGGRDRVKLTPSEYKFRTAVAVLLSLVFLAMVVYATYLFFTVSRGMSAYVLDKEVARLASTLYFDKLTAIAQLTVALLGATWAFRTLPGTRVSLKGWQVNGCFWLTNFSFAFSLIVHYGYGYDFIVSRMFHHLTFDIDAPFVRFISNWQLAFFVFGCFCLLFTVFLGTKREST